MKLSTNGNASFTEQLMRTQESDPELIPLLHSALDATESSKVPTCFYKRNGIRSGDLVQLPVMKSGRSATKLLCLNVFTPMC